MDLMEEAYSFGRNSISKKQSLRVAGIYYINIYFQNNPL